MEERMDTKLNEIKDLMVGLNNKIDKKDKEANKPKQKVGLFCRDYITNGCYWGRRRCKNIHPARCKLFLEKGIKGCASTDKCNKWHPTKCPTMTKNTPELCTNPYCLREHIKWGDLSYFPIENVDTYGAWDGYEWKKIKKNTEEIRRKK